MINKQMINKRKIRYYYKKLSWLKPWHLLLISAFFFVLAIGGLRYNNTRMIELRQAVTAADQAGKDVEGPLAELREFVYGHMNTDLSGGDNPINPPIQLKYRYERLLKSEEARAEKTNATITKRAEAECAKKFPAGGLNSKRVACVQSYVQTNAIDPTAVQGELYKFDFVSPRFSLDFAGICLALGIILLLLSAVWAYASRRVRHLL